MADGILGEKLLISSGVSAGMIVTSFRFLWSKKEMVPDQLAPTSGEQRSVPRTLKRPGWMSVDPRNAAANAGKMDHQVPFDDRQIQLSSAIPFAFDEGLFAQATSLVYTRGSVGCRRSRI